MKVNRLQKFELENLPNWMKIYKLSLKASSSEYTIIGHRRQWNRIGYELKDLFLNNEVIKRVEKKRYLGLTLTKAVTGKSNTKMSRTAQIGIKLLE